MNRTILRLLLTRWNVYARQIFVLAAVFAVSGLFVSLTNYSIVAVVDWYRNLEAPYVGIVPLDLKQGLAEQPLPALLKEHAYISVIEINGVTVSKPNLEDPSYLKYAKSTNTFIVQKKFFEDIVGAGNTLKLLSTPDPTRRGAWLDYNTAKEIRSDVGDLIWISSWTQDENRQLVFFEFEIRGILKPYVEILAPLAPFPVDGILLLEENHVTDEYLSITIPLEDEFIHIRGASRYILLSSKPGSDDDYVIISKSEAIKAGLAQLQLTGGFLVLIIASIVLIIFVSYRETNRVLNGSLYPASFLISMGVRAASVKRYFIFLQYVCFTIALFFGLLGLKYFLFQYLLEMYFGMALILLNIVFLGLIFSIALLMNRHVAQMDNLSLSILDEKRGELI